MHCRRWVAVSAHREKEQLIVPNRQKYLPEVRVTLFERRYRRYTIGWKPTAVNFAIDPALEGADRFNSFVQDPLALENLYYTIVMNTFC